MKYILCVIFLACLLLAGCQDATGETPATVTEASTGTTTGATTAPLESVIEVMREGEISQIPVHIVTGTTGSYTIALDPEYFIHRGEEGLDEFIYAEWDIGLPVYYSVAVYVGDPEQFVPQMTQDYAHLYENMEVSQTTVGGIGATEVVLQGYREDPVYCKHVYLVNGGACYYIMETQFVQEMYEGMYPIMRACLDTFSPVENTD